MMPPRAVNVLLAGAIGVAVAAALVLLFAVSRHREFQVDEVEHLHTAYDIRDGRTIYRDFWQGHPPLLYAMLAPLTDTRDPVGTYLRGRLLLAVILLGTIALTALCAARLAGGWAAVLAAALGLLHTTMIERGIEVRPDGPLALLIVAALAVELAPRAALRRHSIQALLLGLGVLLTQKLILVLLPFGVLWLIGAWRERRPRLVLQPIVLAAVPLLITCAVLATFGVAGTFLQTVYFSATSAVAHAESRATFSPAFFLLRESARNIAFVIAAIAGLIAIAARRRDRAAIFAAALAVTGVAMLWANPFPWPYVHVAFIPLLAVVAGAGLTELVKPAWKPAATALVIALVMTTSLPRLLQKAADSPEQQFAMLREIDRVTPPNARCFDLAGLYFRPDAYPAFAMSGDMLVSYGAGAFPRMVPELRRNAVGCVLFNYRTAALQSPERDFLAAHVAHYWANLYLPGADLSPMPAGATRTFEVLAPRVFRYDGSGAIIVDGVPFARGPLAAGNHRIDILRAAAPSRLIIDTPPPIPPPAPPRELFPSFD
jgi:hypothetical protein